MAGRSDNITVNLPAEVLKPGKSFSFNFNISNEPETERLAAVPVTDSEHKDPIKALWRNNIQRCAVELAEASWTGVTQALHQEKVLTLAEYKKVSEKNESEKGDYLIPVLCGKDTEAFVNFCETIKNRMERPDLAKRLVKDLPAELFRHHQSAILGPSINEEINNERIQQESLSLEKGASIDDGIQTNVKCGNMGYNADSEMLDECEEKRRAAVALTPSSAFQKSNLEADGTAAQPPRSNIDANKHDQAKPSDDSFAEESIIDETPVYVFGQSGPPSDSNADANTSLALTRGSITDDNEVMNANASLTEADWLDLVNINAYNYQKELAEPGLNGKNCIVCAPTGAGKTWVAALVIKDHLQKNGQHGRVLFFAPTVALVQHQWDKLTQFFGDRVDYIVGSEAQNKPRVDDLVKQYQIVCMTPDIFVIALRREWLQLQDVSLMVFDECHHTTLDDAYNRIMIAYLKQKWHGTNGATDLPQVLGMTASLGVGKATEDKSARNYVLQMCANLDCQQIKTVQENKDELRENVNHPEEVLTEAMPKTEHDNFSLMIEEIMNKIEKKVTHLTDMTNSHEACEFLGDKFVDGYRNCLEKIRESTTLSKKYATERRNIISCLDHLEIYFKTLQMYQEVRAKDALYILKRYMENAKTLENSGKPTPVERELQELFNDSESWLTAFSQQSSNPKLAVLKNIILDTYKNQPDTFSILFTTTKDSTKALKLWFQEDNDLKKYRVDRLTGTRNDEGSGMSSQHQRSVVKQFSRGKFNLLIATSVAEEGIDIKACNWIFRYNYLTNEIGRVQSRGRARMKSSKYITIFSADNERGRKSEKINVHREELMKKAVEYISKIDSDITEKIIDKMQKSALKKIIEKENDEKRELDSKSEDIFYVECYLCDAKLCRSDQIVVFEDTNHICISPDIKEYVKEECLSSDTQNRCYGCMRKEAHIYCQQCNTKWGVINSYKHGLRLPVLKAEGFLIYEKVIKTGESEVKKTAKKCKKWRNFPCKFRNIDENELNNIFHS